MNSQPTIVFVGMDIGGTKSSVVYETDNDPGDSRKQFSVHGANFNMAGSNHVIGLISASLVRIRNEMDVACSIHCCAGVAGAGRTENIEALEEAFDVIKTNPEDRFVAYPDTHIAIEGAFSGGPGALVITGTGSGVVGKGATGDFVRAGGWGPRLGDIGSGEQIGRRALRAVARSIDGGPRTALTQMFEIELGYGDRAKIVEAVYDENLRLSTLAPYVLEAAEQNDEIALAILQSEAQELAEEARWVLDQLDENRLSFVGGLVKNESYCSVLKEALLEEIPDVEFFDPDGPPEVGALSLAKRMSN